MGEDKATGMTKHEYLSIGKRDADCYDVYSDKRRVAAIRSDFTEDEQRRRTMVPGTWRIRYEDESGEWIKVPEGIADLHFGTAHEAFAFFCGQVLA